MKRVRLSNKGAKKHKKHGVPKVKNVTTKTKIRASTKKRHKLQAPKTLLTIMINEDWRMRSDGLQFVIERRKVVAEGDRAGTEYWTPQGYCGFLDDAIHFIMTRHILLIEGTYDYNAITVLCNAVDKIMEECLKTLDQAVERMTQEKSS